MPGPAPKPAGLRQRRNRSATRTTLPAESSVDVDKPRMPNCPNDGAWHSMAKRWWDSVWSSPMAVEFLEGDWPAVFRLVVLVDLFWKTQELEVAREIRLMEREFGLTPLSRRRLEWSVVQAEESKERFEQRRFEQAITLDMNDDPRNVLGD